MHRAYRIHGTDENTYRIFAGNMTERYHFGDLGVDCRMVLKYILKKQGGGCGLRVWSQSLALVDMIINLMFQSKRERFFDQLCGC